VFTQIVTRPFGPVPASYNPAMRRLNQTAAKLVSPILLGYVFALPVAMANAQKVPPPEVPNAR
jgi:hypothetical protein